MADVTINNVDDLRAEIARLRLLKNEQGKALGKRFSSPMTALATLYSIFPKSEGSKEGFLHQDIFGIISRILLPFTLNKTIFRNSNFIVKALVGLISQKASHLVTEDKVVGVWDKLKSLFSKKKEKQVDYGIPPDSEAY